MPLANIISSQYRIYLPKTFFYKESVAKFDSYLKDMDIMHETLADYMNTTIVAARIPGISDAGSQEQNYDKGMDRQFKGSMPILKGIQKELTLTFKLKDGFFNWYVMYFNFLEYLNHANKKDRLWMGDMHLHLYDSNGNILSEMIFKQIRITRIADIDLTQADNGVNSANFDVDFYFTHLEFKMYHDKTINPRRGDEITKIC